MVKKKKKIVKINIFNGVLLKCGKKARIYKYLLLWCKILKNPRHVIGIPKTLKNKPLKMIETAIYQCAPFFIYKRIVKAGKLYEIPVPISENRATFMASSWIRKVAQKKTSEGAAFFYFVAMEIINILKRKGGSLEELNKYTADGLEKNIFKKFIRKKFPTVSRSKNINAYRAILAKINKASRKKKFRKRGYQSTFFLMRLRKKHDARNYHQRMLLKKKKIEKRTFNKKTIKK
jgi:ribosomal protein S7